MSYQDSQTQPAAAQPASFAALETEMFRFAQDWTRRRHRYLAAGDGARADCHNVLFREFLTRSIDRGIYASHEVIDSKVRIVLAYLLKQIRT